MILNFDGQSVEITNWEEAKKKFLNAIGFQVEAAVNKNINSMRLVDTGTFKIRNKAKEVNGEVVITNTAPHAVYLEYGTLEYWNRYGLERFSDFHKKKKDMSAKEKETYPRGMQPFAPYRRVLYNREVMTRIINKAWKTLS